MENKQNIKDLIQKFYPHAKEKLGFDHPVRVIMRQDAENAKDSLGKTAYYDPAEKLIVLYITNRHPKDVLRSFSHELVHHAQNCRGDLDDLSTDGHYAGDGKGREIEAEAYLLGNGFLVRDWEDSIKYKGVNEMKLTKTQLKSIVEQTIEKITEGHGKAIGEEKKPFPSFGEWYKANRTKYATPGIAKKVWSHKKIQHEKAQRQQGDSVNQINEQQIDINAIANVLAELRQLENLEHVDSCVDGCHNPDSYLSVFASLADKLEEAMRGQAAPLGSSGELEESKFMDKAERAKEILAKLTQGEGISKEDVHFLRSLLPFPNIGKGGVLSKGDRDPYGKIHKYKDQDDKEIKVRTIDETDELEEQEAQSAPPKKIVPPKWSDDVKRPHKKAVPPKKDLDQVLVTPRSEEEKEEERKKKEEFKKKNPEFSTALDSIKLDENNETWYNSSLYESLKSKWTK